ncbi:TerB N-terminal domain-containing protein [Aeromonas caviae]|uniref:tellurite resistance TerB family protein n=1 Tax=Aeromonas caviae TaxID=648 RepID=UPI00254175FC|nr:TerB N-terminal domain-containing protein [Aeromonas caviae]MDK3166662.1 TerB N-terminal domain-containing protein [Aeromonas caviae]
MARKRRTSKKLGDFYLIILAIVIFITIKIIEAIKAVPWQLWVGAFCVLFLFFTYRYNKTTDKAEKPTVTATSHPTKHTSPVHREPPRAAFAPSPAPSHSNAMAKADTGMRPDTPPHQQPNPDTENVIKVSTTDLMISGASTPVAPTMMNANSFSDRTPTALLDEPITIADYEDEDEDDILTTVGIASHHSRSPSPEFRISFAFEDHSATSDDHSPSPAFTPSELIPAGPRIIARWMSPGEEITLAGLKISGGMFYVGDATNVSGLLSEPSLINPQASVTIKNAPLDLPLEGYYPSYRNLSPEAKKRYLQWMENGRKDPSVAIGYVFIFFYGLERRYFIDAQKDELAKREMPFIEAEVTRLLSIYPHNGSFARYATNFLEYGKVRSISDTLYQLPAPEADPFFCMSIPFSLKICLGQLVRDNKPVPADWALLWATCIPTISLRTPAQRCFDIFKAMFMVIYKREFGDGIKLKALKARVELFYYPASGALGRLNCTSDLSDVSLSKAYSNKLSKIVDLCTSLLEPYSRYLGRNVGSENTLEALLHLPYQYWPTAMKQTFVTLEEVVGVDAMLLPWSDLAARINIDNTGGLNKAQYEGLATILAHHHMSIKPHPEGSNKRPKGDEPVVIYPINPQETLNKNQSSVDTVSAFVDLACVVLNTDEDKSAVTIAFLKEQIGSMTFLTHSQSVRLIAKALLGTQAPPTLSIVKKAIDALDGEQKALVGKLLVAFVKADNSITPAKVKVLEQLYKLISLDVKQVYSDLHSNEARIVSTSKSGSVTKATGSASSLDMARVAQLKQETSQVTAMLASVFTENDGEHDDIHQPQQAKTEVSPGQTVEPTTLGDTHSLFGLDDDLSQFLRALLTRPEWARDDLSELASTMGLMLDGALEQINEVMLDHFDEMLIDGDDPFELNTDLLEQIPHE